MYLFFIKNYIHFTRSSEGSSQIIDVKSTEMPTYFAAMTGWVTNTHYDMWMVSVSSGLLSCWEEWRKAPRSWRGWRAFLWHLEVKPDLSSAAEATVAHVHVRGAPHHIPFVRLISGTWGAAPCTPGSHGELAQVVSKCGWTKDTVATSANERWIPQPPVEKSEAFCSFPQSPQSCLQWEPGEAFTGFPPFLAHCPRHLTSASWDHLPNKLCEPSFPSQALLSEGAPN